LNGVALKNPTYDQVVRVADMLYPDGTHAAMLQTLGGGTWHDTAILAGINVADVGADHHALKLSDLGIG
jgi:hypothetical protein